MCAHVGANTPVDALTPFPLTGPGAHAATIAPRVVVIDAAGNTATYDLGAAGISGSLSHYAGSTDVHEGFVQMWVPFTFGMREPGFTVRVEVRGTPILPGGGTTQVMGADEVFVHLGPAPQHMAGIVYQALGVALDDGAIAERPDDPGADDLSSYFGPAALPAIKSAIEALAPRDIDDGRLNSLDWWGGPPTLDLVDVTSDVSDLTVQLSGIATIQATVYPREWGIVAGSCEVSAALPVTATATFSLGFNPDHSRPRAIVHSLDRVGHDQLSHGDGRRLGRVGSLPAELPQRRRAPHPRPGDRQDRRADQRPGRQRVACRSAGARAATSATSGPILGGVASSCGCTPCASSASEHTGPIEATTMRPSAPRRAPASGATRKRCSTCTALVNTATSSSPADQRRRGAFERGRNPRAAPSDTRGCGARGGRGARSPARAAPATRRTPARRRARRPPGPHRRGPRAPRARCAAAGRTGRPPRPARAAPPAASARARRSAPWPAPPAGAAAASPASAASARVPTPVSRTTAPTSPRSRRSSSSRTAALSGRRASRSAGALVTIAPWRANSVASSCARRASKATRRMPVSAPGAMDAHCWPAPGLSTRVRQRPAIC